MALFNAAAVLIALAALFSWLNYRFIRLPATIAMLLFSLATSIGLVALASSAWIPRRLRRTSWSRCNSTQRCSKAC
jgi:hypothetical protein